MKTSIIRFFFDQSGATAIEYGMIAALMSVAVAAAYPSVTTTLTSTLEAIGARFPGN